MLKLLRKKGVAKKLIWIIAVVIIISFGFLGTAYLITGNPGTEYAGKIFGKKVPLDDFKKVYQNARIQAIRQYGYNLSKVEHFLNLESQTWDRLILLHEVNKRKIKIRNEEIVQTIEQDKSFEKNGQFDILLYNTILRNLQIRPRDYEENVRDNLKIAKLVQEEAASVVLTEEDIFQEYKKRNEKAQASYVFVSFESMEGSIPQDLPLAKQYYEDHTSDFLAPPTINAQYLTFDFPPQPEESDPPEEAPKETEETANNEEYEQQKNLVREQADKVFQELLINPDMDAIARQYNLVVQTSGFFSMEQPNLTLGWSYDLLNKIFQMNLNEINEPVETSSGISIVQIKEKRESYIPEFEEVAERVHKAVVSKKAKELAKERAEEYLQALQTELSKSKLRDFPKAAKILNLELHQTPAFSRGQYLPQIGISKEFQEEAFKLTADNKMSSVVEASSGYCILHLDNYIPIDPEKYEEEKEALAKTLSEEKQNAAFGDFLMQLRQKANLDDNIAKLRGETP